MVVNLSNYKQTRIKYTDTYYENENIQITRRRLLY